MVKFQQMNLIRFVTYLSVRNLGEFKHDYTGSILFIIIQMQSVLLSLTSAGMRHRDRKTTGNVMGSKINSSLKQYFFGSQCTEKLTTRSFIEFQQRLQKEVLFLEVSI